MTSRAALSRPFTKNSNRRLARAEGVPQSVWGVTNSLLTLCSAASAAGSGETPMPVRCCRARGRLRVKALLDIEDKNRRGLGEREAGSRELR